MILTHPEINADTLPSFCRARTLILGVGNILFGNDGFGPQVAETLNRGYALPDEVVVLDVGTGARKVLFTIALGENRPEEIIVVDAVDWGREVGSVHEVPVESLPVTKIDDFSLHQVPTSNMLRELQDGGVKVTVVVCDVGMIPQEIAPGLSPIIGQAAVTASLQIAVRLNLKPDPR